MTRRRRAAASLGLSKLQTALRGLLVLLACVLALQVFWVLRVTLMAVVNPSSTTFQRSEMWRMAREQGWVAWGHEWVPSERIAEHLKRAVIASEDANFVHHGGMDWVAMERARDKNERTLARRSTLQKTSAAEPLPVGASSITQQLAKNLFLSGERTTLRKAQELVIAWALELSLSKARILEIYLNSVEWGEGLFGAQMAARYYHRVDAAQLSRMQAARLAVMLPAPKRYEKRPQSAYLNTRAASIAASMDAVTLP
jgi:monofunctional glycosyltransferase